MVRIVSSATHDLSPTTKVFTMSISRLTRNTGQLRKGQKFTKTSLEEEEKHSDGEEKTEFLRFIWRMLQWDPASRPSARELVNDPFLHLESDAGQKEEVEKEENGKS